jgi:hypothetical protein
MGAGVCVGAGMAGGLGVRVLVAWPTGDPVTAGVGWGADGFGGGVHAETTTAAAMATSERCTVWFPW